MSKYNSLLDYIKWRGDLSFKASPFNHIDAMILAQLSSVKYDDTVPGASSVDSLTRRPYSSLPTLEQVAKQHYASFSQEQITDGLEAEDYILHQAGQSNRFKNIRLDAYITDTDKVDIKQFSAITFYLTPRLVYIAFRGTDDTFISWEENFHMSYMFPIPAQTDAVKYLEIMGNGFLRKSIVGGHSKGGNMAVYASTFCNPKLQRSIKTIYAFDSPGFSQDISGNKAFINIRERIVGYMPVKSIIGTLMKVPYSCLIVNSTADSVSQHHMYNWEIIGTSPVYVDDRSQFSYNFEETFSDKLNAIPDESRSVYSDELFAIFKDNNIHKIGDFSSMDFKQVLGLLKGATSISATNRNLLLSVFKLLWDDQRKNK